MLLIVLRSLSREVKELLRLVMSVQEEQTEKFIVDTFLGAEEGKMLISRLLAHIELLLLTPAASCSGLSISSACGHRRLRF